MSIDSLAKMWITQADLKLLLNDKKVPLFQQDIAASSSPDHATA